MLTIRQGKGFGIGGENGERVLAGRQKSYAEVGTEEEVWLIKSRLWGCLKDFRISVLLSSDDITDPLCCLQLKHSVVAYLPVVLFWRIKNKDYVPHRVMVLEGIRAGAGWWRAQWK